MDNFSDWPLAKQYLAAHYYLSEEKPMSISEAQRAQLGALHLYISYGKYTENVETPDLILCSAAEKKKRIEEWKKLSPLSNMTAMQKFLDLLSSLFPNWKRSRKLIYDFSLEWSSLQQAKKKPKKSPDHSQNSRGYRKNVGKSLVTSGTELFHLQNELEKESINHIKQVKQQNSKRPKHSRTQSIEIQNTLYSLKEVPQEKLRPKYPYVADSIEKHRNSITDANYMKVFLENLQSYKGGNIKDTSAPKFPKLKETLSVALPEPDPPINFEKELKKYRRTLLQEEFNKFKPGLQSVDSSLHSGFNKIQDQITALKLKLQQFN